MPFIAAELYLRATLRVDSADLTSDPIFETSGQSPLFVQAADADRMEIPESRMNFFRPASFAIRKGDNVRRIFVLGGSTVQGRPYETETAFSTWTQLRLQASDRSHEYEVINCGGVSYASYRVAIILEEVLRYSPDAIVLYTGHNEFLEERSYDTMGEQGGLLSRLGQNSRLLSSVRERLQHDPITRQDLPGELRTRLDLINGMQRYVRHEQWRRGVADHFRDTLGRMIGMCQAAGVPLLLCVPTSDVVRTPPIKVQMADLDAESAAAFRVHYEIAKDRDADTRRRIAACRACLELDPHHAGAHYIAGILHWSNRRSDEAKTHLIAARDDDVCPLRATTPLLESILQLAQQHDLNPIRCDLLFDRTDSLLRPIPDGIEDPQRFVDHVHPTIAGHQEIAVAVSNRLIELLLIGVDESAEDRCQELWREHLSSLDETYFDRGKQRLAGLLNWAAGRAGKLSVDTQQ